MNKIPISIFFVFSFLSTYSQKTEFITDPRDGKVYNTVVIGKQTWFAENLAFKADSGCWAYNDSAIYVVKYGYLYNWETAQNVCPAGWHLPSDIEWQSLIDFLGDKETAGKILRSASGWNIGAVGSNTYDFSGLPGGFRDKDGTFSRVGSNACWWSSTDFAGPIVATIYNEKGELNKIEEKDQPAKEAEKTFAFARQMFCRFFDFLRTAQKKDNGFNVRCVKD